MGYEWNDVDHAMTCKCFSINGNEHKKDETQKFERNFHLFQCLFSLSFMSLVHTHAKIRHTHKHSRAKTQKYLLCVLRFYQKHYTAYHVKYMMGKCIP